MRKTQIAAGSISLALALSLGSPAFGATSDTPAPETTQCTASPAIFTSQYKRTVITEEATPGSDAIEEVSHVEYRFERKVVTTEAADAIPAEVETQVKWSKSNFIKGWTRTDETKTVVTTEAVPGTDAVEEVSHTEYRFERTVIDVPFQEAVAEVTEQVIDNPGQPYIAPTYKTVVVTPAVDAQPEESHLKYQYQKEVKGEIQVKTKRGGWERHNAFGWETYPSTQWSTTNTPFLSEGPHSTVLDEYTEKGQQYRKVTTEYRYKQTGVTEKVITKPAVPAKPAVTKEVVDNPGQPEIKPTYKTVVVTEAKDAVQEVSHVETSEWATEAPEGDGWKSIDERKVVTTEAAEAIPGTPEVSHTLYKHQREVVLTEGVDAVEEVSHTEDTGWLVAAPEGEGWSTIGERKVVTTEAADATPGTPEVSHEEIEWFFSEPQADGGWEATGETRIEQDAVTCEVAPVTPTLPTLPTTGVSAPVAAPVVAPVAKATAPVATPVTKAATPALAQTGLAQTGIESNTLALGALGLMGLGGVLIAARKRAARDS